MPGLPQAAAGYFASGTEPRPTPAAGAPRDLRGRRPRAGGIHRSEQHDRRQRGAGAGPEGSRSAGAPTPAYGLQPPSGPAGLPPGLRRSSGDRVVAGVAGGLGRWLGVDPVMVRLAFLVLAIAGGFGLALYVAARFLIPEAESPGREPEPRPATPRGALALALVVTGTLLFLRSAGWWTVDGLVWPLAVAAVGSGLVWTRGSDRERARWARLAGRLAGSRDPWTLADRPGPLAIARALLGGGLLIGGVIGLLASSDAFVNAADLLGVASVLGVGFVLLLGPLVLRLTRQLGDERRERIRSEERAEMAAHLHDSVLQTLALIQRSPDQAESVRLARSQERELRAWLFGKPQDLAGRRLGAAVESAAAAVEERLGVPIEVVGVGDCDLDEHLRALVTAAAEAMANAARHSGAPVVTVYVEVEPGTVIAYVRDEGTGFVEAAVPADRKGVSESIRGRMTRHGGTAAIDSVPGEGTEVELRMPRRADAEADEEPASPTADRPVS